MPYALRRSERVDLNHQRLFREIRRSVTNAAGASISGETTGVYGGTKGAVTVTNSGNITVTATGSAGVDLAGGGQVTNNSSGQISGSAFGVFVSGVPGTVVNSGQITGQHGIGEGCSLPLAKHTSGLAGDVGARGVGLEAGGSVTNTPLAARLGLTPVVTYALGQEPQLVR
jgi:hypothetical protein